MSSLAYPSGRLVRRFDRLVVITGYAVYLCLDLVRLLCKDGFTGRSGDVVLTAQRAATGVVAPRGRRGLRLAQESVGPSGRFSLEFLVACFSLALATLVAATIMVSLGAPGRDEARGSPSPWWAWRLSCSSSDISEPGLRDPRSQTWSTAARPRPGRAGAGPRSRSGRPIPHPRLLVAGIREHAEPKSKAIILPERGTRAVTHIERDGARGRRPASRLVTPGGARAPRLRRRRAQPLVGEHGCTEPERGSRSSVARARESSSPPRANASAWSGTSTTGLSRGSWPCRSTSACSRRQLDGSPVRDGSRSKGRGREVAASLEGERNRTRHSSGCRHGPRPGSRTRAARGARCGSGGGRSESAGAFPEAVEVASYYVVAETLTNVGKYAQATTATVDVSRSPGLVVVKVNDDGIGGADTERGSGLRGLADRVEASAAAFASGARPAAVRVCRRRSRARSDRRGQRPAA